MAELAPDALKWLGSRISPDLGGVLSGIVGDSAHKSGYHRGRNYVPTTDYSRQLTEDKSGSGEVACAIDMSFDTARMKLYTGRLKAAADRNDPRLKYVREFYGTLNGTTVYGRTHRGTVDATWESATSDSSHLWHVHMSILRQYANIQNVISGILDVLKGKPLVEEDMLPDERAALLYVKDLMARWRGGWTFMSDEKTDIAPVSWRIRDEAWQKSTDEKNAKLAQDLADSKQALAEVKQAVANITTAPAVTDEQLERVLRKVIGGVDGATPAV